MEIRKHADDSPARGMMHTTDMAAFQLQVAVACCLPFSLVPVWLYDKRQVDTQQSYHYLSVHII
jgi:hypothetical protein